MGKRASPTAAAGPAKKVAGDEPVPVTPSPAVAAAATQGQAIVSAPPAAGPSDIPADDTHLTGADLYQLMKRITASVRAGLTDMLCSSSPEFKQFRGGVEVHEHQPLPIPDGESDAMTSYKAPWTSAQAQSALSGTGLYEAAVNILWLNPFPADDDAAVIAGDPPLWTQVVQVAETHMSLEASQAKSLAASQGQSKVARILFPVVVPVHAPNVEFAGASAFNMALPVVAGQVYIYGWYLALFRALQGKDIPRAAALWQAGLTTSVQLRAGLRTEQLAVWSIQSSETRKAQDQLFTDSFSAFALKALKLVTEDSKAVKVLGDAGITFRGSKVNKSMVTAIMMFRDSIDARGLAILRQIELSHGRDVFSSGYVKLARVVQTCTEVSRWGNENASEVINFVLGFLEFALRMEEVKASELTVASLDKTRDGTPGLVPVALARRQVVQHVRLLVEDLRSTGAAPSAVKDLDSLFACLQTYETYEAAFKPPGDLAMTTDVASASPQGDGAAEDPVEIYKTAHTTTKVGQLAVDFFYDLFAMCHDAQLKAALKDKALKDIDWDSVEIDAFRELCRQLTMQRIVVSAQACHAPVPGARALRRYASDGADGAAEQSEILKERNEVLCPSGWA